MKPSRFFYIVMGGCVVGTALLPIPGAGAFCAFLFMGAAAAAITFDWNDA